MQNQLQSWHNVSLIHVLLFYEHWQRQTAKNFVLVFNLLFCLLHFFDYRYTGLGTKFAGRERWVLWLNMMEQWK